jgi:hypothetical protein
MTSTRGLVCLNKILSEEEPGTPGCMPLEVWDAISSEVEGGEPEGAGSQDRTMTATGKVSDNGYYQGG